MWGLILSKSVQTLSSQWGHIPSMKDRFLALSGENPTTKGTDCMGTVRTYIQSCIEILNRVLDASAGKTSCVSLVYRFTRLVRQGDNPNKESLIDIIYISCHHCSSRHNPGCRQTSQAYSNFKSYLWSSLSGCYLHSVMSMRELLDV